MNRPARAAGMGTHEPPGSAVIAPSPSPAGKLNKMGCSNTKLCGSNAYTAPATLNPAGTGGNSDGTAWLMTIVVADFTDPRVNATMRPPGPGRLSLVVESIAYEFFSL